MRKKQPEKQEPMKKKRIILFVLIFIFLIFSVSLIITGNKANDPNDSSIEQFVILRTHADTLRFCDELQTMIFELRIEHPEIVFAQAQLETANFTSEIWIENNNLFGIKQAWRRITTCVGVNRSHAIYANWRYSVIDYAFWQLSYAKGLTEEEYYAKLQSTYAEDPSYTRKIKDLARKNRNKF